jgi:hypothetical protein
MPAGSGPVVQRSEALKGRYTIAQGEAGEALGRQRYRPRIAALESEVRLLARLIRERLAPCDDDPKAGGEAGGPR